MTLELILLVMSVLGIYEGFRLSKATLLFADSVGPGWYLFFMACLLCLCALALLVRDFKRRKAVRQQVDIALHKSAAGQALLLLIVYGIAATLAGYIVASVIFFVLVQRVFGERSWVKCGVVGVTITACFYLVFSYLAEMPLP